MDLFRRIFSGFNPTAQIKEIEDETIDRWVRNTNLSEDMVRTQYKFELVRQFEDQVNDHKELRDHLKTYKRTRF